MEIRKDGHFLRDTYFTEASKFYFNQLQELNGVVQLFRIKPTMRPQSHIVATVVLVTLSACQIKANDYYGNLIGSFTNRFHGITGDVYTVDSRTLFIKGFSYDGQGPDAYFYAGESGSPSEDGYIIANEKGTEDVLSVSALTWQ